MFVLAFCCWVFSPFFPPFFSSLCFCLSCLHTKNSGVFMSIVSLHLVTATLKPIAQRQLQEINKSTDKLLSLAEQI